MEKIWLKNYEAGVPYTINVDQYSTLVEMLEESVDCFTDNIGFSNLGSDLTYRKVDHLTQALAGFLQVNCDLMKGDRVAIMMPNCLQYPVSLFAALRAGLIVININPLYTSRELRIILKDCGAKAIIILENFVHTLQEVIADTQVKHVIVSQYGDLFPFPKRTIINFALKHIKKMVPPWTLSNKITTFREAVATRHRDHYHKVILDSDDIAFIQYTGGTTADAKGAVLTHRNMVSNVLQINAWMNSILSQLKKGAINPLPLYHIFSLTVTCFAFLKAGLKVILISNPRDVPGFIRELKRQPFSVFLGVNTLLNLLLHSTEFRKLDFSGFQLTIVGGMSLQRSVAERWQEVTKGLLIEGYGLTEASPVVAVNPLTIKGFTASVGLPLPSTDVKICDEDGEEVPLGENGELLVKGPQVMNEYWKKSEFTKKVFSKEGWLRTGDISYIDERGFIHIIERKHDLIIVSGFNVYPAEVEEVISTIPGVFEVAVVGVFSEASEQKVKAYVVRSDPALTAEEIIRDCHKSLTNYKIPREIEFRTALPKSTVGKILRRVLREEANQAKKE